MKVPFEFDLDWYGAFDIQQPILIVSPKKRCMSYMG